MAQSVVSLHCTASDAIGATTDIGLREGQIGPQRLTHNGRNKKDIKSKTVAFYLGRVKTTTLAGRAKTFCINFVS